jgi:hypothetical protein
MNGDIAMATDDSARRSPGGNPEMMCDKCGKPAGRLDSAAVGPHRAPNVESEAAAVCNAAWHLQEFEATYVHRREQSYEAWSNYHSRLGWLIDNLMRDAASLERAVWGDDHWRLTDPLDDTETQECRS